MFQDLLTLLARTLDGQRALDDAAAIWSLDRQFTSTSFHESARYSAERLREAALSKVEILEAPADGRSLYGDWMMPLAWEVEGATFDLIGADGGAQRIADRAQAPACLTMWSAPTPPEGVTGDIVWIPDAADPASYPADAVRDKIVFTSVRSHQAKRAVLERGALGILSDFQPAGARLPDAITWVNSWSDDPGGWAFHADDTPAWAFSISPRQGEQIRARLEAGEKLRGHAVVRSTLAPGTLPAVTALIPGTDREEVLLIGHQFEQGAIDNASGVAIMIEAMRGLQSLIAEGKLPPPRRSIRCLFVSECYTTLYWAATSRAARRTAAALCLDSPAGPTELMARPLGLYANPHSRTSYTDALLGALMRSAMPALPGYPWQEYAFSATDNMIAEGSIGIPCPWLGAHSRTWHTSADTADLLDAAVLSTVAQVSAAYAYLIASADRQLALDCAHLAAARGKAALAAAGMAELDRLSGGDLDDAVLQLAYLAERQAEAVASAVALAPGEQRAEVRRQVRPLQREVRRAGRAEAEALARRAGRPGHSPGPAHLDPQLAGIRPRRLVLGPVTLDRVPRGQREGRPDSRWSSALFSLLSWCDGDRSLAEACELAARELRRGRTLSPDELVKQIDPNAPTMLDYLDFLRRHGYLSW